MAQIRFRSRKSRCLHRLRLKSSFKQELPIDEVISALSLRGPGSWRVVIDDEEGHRREIQVTIPQTFASTSLSPLPTSSRLERALLGISLIIGATGFLYGFKTSPDFKPFCFCRASFQIAP